MDIEELYFPGSRGKRRLLEVEVMATDEQYGEPRTIYRTSDHEPILGITEDGQTYHFSFETTFGLVAFFVHGQGEFGTECEAADVALLRQAERNGLDFGNLLDVLGFEEPEAA